MRNGTCRRSSSCGRESSQSIQSIVRVTFPRSEGVYIHRNAQRLVPTADQDAADGTHIAVVSTPPDRGMAQGRKAVVRWAHVYPTDAGKEKPCPGVGRAHAAKLWPAGRRAGLKVSAHVARRQTLRAQTDRKSTRLNSSH